MDGHDYRLEKITEIQMNLEEQRLNPKEAGSFDPISQPGGGGGGGWIPPPPPLQISAAERRKIM